MSNAQSLMLSSTKHTLIIAEAGVNHNGELAMARQLIDVAAEAGADLVKFQTFKAEKLVSPEARKAQYQEANTGGQGNSTQFDMLKQLELTEADHQELMAYAQERGIGFFSTAFDEEGLDYLHSLGFDRFKVPSGEITNYPYLKKLAGFGKPVILSTGMATMTEIEAALNILCSEGLKLQDITVLHCNTEYPTPMADVNLRAMQTIGATFGVAIGYSDHTAGIEVPIAAVAMGAGVIEKHFTLDRHLPGPDHRASLEPAELKAMIQAIRNIELALSGDGIKRPTASELPNREVARKSIFIQKAMEANEVIVTDHLIALRPGNGISPMEWERIIGRRAARPLPAGHQLQWSDLN